MDQSPFAFDISAEEGRRRRLAISADLVTDETGLMIAFRSEADVEAALTDPRFGAVAMPILQFSGVTEGPLFDMWSLLMFGKDGDEHKRLRSTVARDFTPRAVERYRPEIEAFAAEMADRVVPGEPFEVWETFALPLSARATALVVGVPIEDCDRVAIWALHLVNAFFVMQPERRVLAENAAVEFSAYLDELIASKRSNPGDDIVSKLTADAAQHDLSYEETRALIANLVFGGLEATAKAITNGVYHLVVNNQWGQLAARPENAANAVIELLRFAPPVGTARFAREDLVVQDVQLAAGQLVTLDVEAASRDSRKVAHPEVLDLTREPGRQLTFGAGAHFCLGANLAKVVLESAFRELPVRFPTLELAGEPDEVGWDYETFYGIVALPVVAPPDAHSPTASISSARP
jgi:cytochrome P450